MRAVVIHAPKDLRIDDVAEPAVGPGEVAVRIRAGGICGSDLHYYQHGGFGTVRIREPMILGHEIAGEVAAIGDGVTGLTVGTRAAIDPSRPCYQCSFCRRAEYRHCTDMRFFGSAMRFPHVQGGFREVVVVPAGQVFPIADKVTIEEAAIAEPLAVCLHAARRANLSFGKRVLVTGCGPIGILCIALARLAGASEIVATDVADFPLSLATRMGADAVINVANDAERLAAFGANKGTFDILFEASGNEAAIRSAIDVLRPGAVAVQVGLAGGAVPMAINALVAKEIDYRGTFRFDVEFGEAVALINRRAVDFRPLVTEVLPFTEARRGFDLATDRSRSMKVQLAF